MVLWAYILLPTPACASAEVSFATLPPLEILVGESRVFETPGLTTVAVGDETVADVVVSGPEEFLVNGKKAGTTTLLVWADGERSLRSIVVLPHRRPDQTVLQSLLGPEVAHTWVGTTLLLTGRVQSLQERERIESAITKLWPETVSAVTIAADRPAEESVRKEQALVRILGNLYPKVDLHHMDGFLVIKGEVPHAEDIENLEKLAAQLDLVPVMQVTVADSHWQEAINLPVKLGLPKAWVQRVGRLLLLRGYVESDAEAEALEAAVSQYGETINLLRIAGQGTAADSDEKQPSVQEDISERALSQIRELIANPDIAIHLVDGKVLLLGTVSSHQEAVIAEKIARVFVERVVNCLRVDSSQVQGTGDTEIGTEKSRNVAFKEPAQNGLDETVDRRATNYLLSLGVELQELGNGVVLASGRVSEESSRVIREILDRVYPGWIDNLGVESLLPGQKEAEFLSARAPRGVQVELVDGQILLSGTCSEHEKQTLEMQAAALWPDVVSTIVSTEDTRVVQVQVRILEVTDDSLSELGVDVSAAKRFGDTQPAQLNTSTGSLQLSLSAFDEVELVARLNALVNAGKVRTLATPNLVLTSGKQASFLAGGEIPLPVKSEEEVSIEWREYGVKLNVSAEILSDSIRVDVEPEVSLLDWSNQITIDDVDIPAIRTRRASTSVYLEDGDSIVIGGLIGEEEQRTVAKVPLLGDLPIIGALFRSERYQTHRSDLVIILTPRVGAPESSALLEGSL